MPIRIDLKPLAPAEAVEFFQQKGYALSFDYRDVDAAEHQASFTVAKAMQMDVLAAIRAQVDDALANGGTLATFTSQLKPGLQQAGWWGVKEMADPKTGEVKDVQLGSPRRLKTIYDTNLRTAHSEGQWQRIQEVKDAMPYLMYDHTPSAHERKEHLAWDGMVFAVDDPWVMAHFPVKAWGCKCRMTQMGKRQLDRQGLVVSPAPATPDYSYVNKRTGEVQQIPAGVDPSFHYPPGGRRSALTDNMVSSIERLPTDLRPAAVRAIGPEAFNAWAAKPAGAWPVGTLPEKLAERLGARSEVVRLAPAIEGAAPAISAAELDQVADALTATTMVDDDLVKVVIDRGGEPVAFEIPRPPAGGVLLLQVAKKTVQD